MPTLALLHLRRSQPLAPLLSRLVQTRKPAPPQWQVWSQPLAMLQALALLQMLQTVEAVMQVPKPKPAKVVPPMAER